MVKVILSGNLVRGFVAYEVPDDETTIKFFLGKVPESRLVEVHSYDDLMTEYNSDPVDTPPEPASTEEVSNDDVGGPADGEDSGASGGSEDGPDDGGTQ